MRKGRAKKRQVLPDPKFGNEMISRFVNNMMVGGKKNVAYRIFYDALEIIEKKTNQDGVEVFEKALDNIMPMVEVRSRRVGGSTFQVPSEVRPNRRVSLGIKWLIAFTRKRNEKSMKDKLAAELVAASRGEGGAVKKREDAHRMAEANKAFSHFRF
ncbi:MAG TPA: 30S ribosomal protein S7 [Bacteroidetes bacterium]|nr:30S ribosomal protein S7 [Bacteroidota bacterium]